MVEGLVIGNLGEASEAIHCLVDILVTSRARVAETQTNRSGKSQSEEGMKGLAVGFIWRRLEIVGIKAQCHSLPGRVEMLGPGGRIT